MAQKKKSRKTASSHFGDWAPGQTVCQMRITTHVITGLTGKRNGFSADFYPKHQFRDNIQRNPGSAEGFFALFVFILIKARLRTGRTVPDRSPENAPGAHNRSVPGALPPRSPGFRQSPPPESHAGCRPPVPPASIPARAPMLPCPPSPPAPLCADWCRTI